MLKNKRIIETELLIERNKFMSESAILDEITDILNQNQIDNNALFYCYGIKKSILYK